MDPSPSQRFSVAAFVGRHFTSVLRHAVLIAVVAAPITAYAQPVGAVGNGYLFNRPEVSLTVRGGLDRPTASSEIWSFTTRNLTVDKGDFIAPGYQVDLGVRLTNRTELVVTAGNSVRSARSEFRDFIDNNDRPIEQTTRLRRLPVTAGVRFAIRPPEERLGRLAWVPARFTPWIGAGGGALGYTFSQIGDFVDFQTLNVFRQSYAISGWTPMAYANLGLDVRLTTRVGLTGDLRYSMARAPMDQPGSKFSGFNKIDLSGTAATMGFTFRM